MAYRKLIFFVQSCLSCDGRHVKFTLAIELVRIFKRNQPCPLHMFIIYRSPSNTDCWNQQDTTNIMTEQNQLASLLADNLDPISDLNSLLPIATSVSSEEFISACSGLLEGVDLRNHVNPRRRSIRIGGARSLLYITPFQLYQALLMLNQRDRTQCRGGILSNDTGTGKSYIILAACVIRALVFESERQVKLFWDQSKPSQTNPSLTKPNPTKPNPTWPSPSKPSPSKPSPTMPNPRKASSSVAHLPQSAIGQGLRCPSQRGDDVICYCVPTSKARALVDSDVPRGASLIQVPVSLMPQSCQIFENAGLNTSACNIFIIATEVPLRLRRDFSTIAKSLSQPPARDSAAPESYIFLSSHFANAKVFQTFVKCEINLGLHFIDESHQAMKLETRPMAIAEAQSKVGPQGLDLFLVSATPIRSLADWELPMGLWCNSVNLSRAAAVRDLITAHAAAKSSRQNMDSFLALWSQIFDRDLVIRNLITSKFCGQPISDLQVVKPTTVWLQTPSQHRADVQAIADQAREDIRTLARAASQEDVAFKPDYASGLDARLHFLSLFPGAATLMLQNQIDVKEESVRNTIAAIKDGNKLKIEKSARLQKNLEQVEGESPKLDFILAEIQRMCGDKDQRRADPSLSADAHGENLALKKMLIVTPTLGTAAYLYLILLRRVPELNPVLIHTRARPSDREAALNSFTTLTARKTAKHSYILITPFSSGGTGLNLQTANYQILVSPLRSKDMETQCFARTNRSGQRLALHHSRLITEDNPADRINIVSYSGRSIRNDPFAIGGLLIVSEADGFKRIQRLTDWGYVVRNLQRGSVLTPDLYPNYEVRAHEILPSPDERAVDKLLSFDIETIAHNVLAVTDAWNSINDSRPRHEKLPLRDILLGFWHFHLNRSVGDLKHLVYCDAVEVNLSDILKPQVYTLLGAKKEEKLVVHSAGETPEETQAFSSLLEKAPFCIGAQKMLEEYSELSEVQIDSFEFLPANGESSEYFDFRINFR